MHEELKLHRVVQGATWTAAIPIGTALQAALDEFRLFHNHVQPHQNVQGNTPAEVWNAKQARSTGANKASPVFVTALHGLLAGFYFPPLRRGGKRDLYVRAVRRMAGRRVHAWT